MSVYDCVYLAILQTWLQSACARFVFQSNKVDASLHVIDCTNVLQFLLHHDRVRVWVCARALHTPCLWYFFTRLDATSAAELESKWKAKAERKDAIAAEVREVTKVFFCEPCRKQYKTVSEFDNHLSSYDHHHTLRLKDLRERERKQKQGRSGDGKKRDRREAERELERISKMASSKADVQAGSQPPLAGARSSAGTSGAGQAVQPPRPPAPSGSSTAPQQTLGGWSSMPVGTSSASRQPDRTTPTAGGWTQAAPAERATPTGGGWMQAAPAEDDAAAASAAAKQEERRRKLEAWKAAQSSVTPITQASIRPPPSSSGFGFAQRGTQQSSMPSASAGPVSATGTATATNDQRARVTAAPARPTAVMAAFGGGSSDEDDAPEEAPQQKKHRALWQPT